MSIPFLLLIAVTLFSIYICLSVATVSIAVWKRRLDRDREQSRQRVRSELFERQERDDPNWEDWIASLSGTEREVLGRVVERYLHLVTGSQRDTLLTVADILELGSRVDAKLDQSAVVPRLRALATLSVLSYPVSISRLEATCTDTQRVREAVARLLYERRDAYPNAAERGTKLLLWDGSDPLSVYGLETLSLLNSNSETPLLTVAETAADTWDRAVLVQVCRVLEQTQAVDPDATFDWVLPLLETPDPTVRAAAIRALTPQGWRNELRERIDLTALTTDSSPRVRRAVYEMLGEWGDEESREALVQGVCEEPDPRCQLVGVRAIAALNITPLTDKSTWPIQAWNWLEAERESGQEGVVTE